MIPTRAAGRGCLLRALRAYALFVLASVAVTVSLGYLAAAHALRRAERAWAEQAEPMDSFVARYPAQPDSPAGVALDALTRPLGVRMCGPSEPDPPGGDKTHVEFLQSLGKFLSECGHAGSDACPALPAPVETFLEREAPRLDAIETHILQGGPLHWVQDLSKGVAAPFPSLLGHRQLSSVLLTRAMLHARRGRPELAERSLEAGWVLNASFAERPDFLSRLITVSVSGMNNAVLRTIKTPSDRWLPHMQQRTFAADVRIPYQLEAWNWTRFTVGLWGIFDVSYMESGEKPPATILGTPGRVLTAPYVRLSFAGVSEALLKASQTLRSEKRCDFDVDRYSKEFEDSFPRWNVLGRIATPSVLRGFTSMRYADLDRELTEQVIAARKARLATGRWPSAPTASTVCEGVAWKPQAGSDGSVTIGASVKPFATDDPQWTWSIRLHP